MIFLIFEQNRCSFLSREARAAAVERMRVGGRARRRVLLALALAPAGPRAVAANVHALDGSGSDFRLKAYLNIKSIKIKQN
jgi:hypothetical protein